MIAKTELLTILALPADADLAAVREAVRALDGRALDAVAAQAVMGWTTYKQYGTTYWQDAEGNYKGAVHPYPSYSDDLNTAAALMPRIEEMGLKGIYNAILISITGDEEVTPLEDDGYPCWALTDYDVWVIANATARQRTEASVLAVYGRVMG